MDHFTLIFILIAGGGIFIFWRIAKFIYKKLLASYKPDSSDRFVDAKKIEPLGNGIDEIVNKLETERQRLYIKTNGLYKRSFLRSSITIAAMLFLFTYFSGPERELRVDDIVGPILMAAIMAAIGSGIYTLIRKGMNTYKFSALLKRELVAKLAKLVNPALRFRQEGITKEVFNRAGLFAGTVFKSEDRLEGQIEGQNVVLSECEQRSSSTSNNSNKSIVYFKGLFVQLDLKQIRTTEPLKIIPSSNYEAGTIKLLGLDKVLGNNFGRHYKVREEDRLQLMPQKSTKYLFFSGNKVEAIALLTPLFLKVVEYIFHKFDYKDIFISISGHTLYMALSWNEDLFETDVFLKKNLIESGIANKIYRDLIFLDQIIKEVNLMNKVDVDQNS